MTPDEAHEPFITHRTIRFGEVDVAGVVYFPAFMNHFHIALEEFMAGGLKIPYPQMIQKDRIGLPTVGVKCDFTGPVQYGDEIDIRVWLSRLGGASAVFEFEARKEGEVCARASLTKVVIDLASWKPIMIPKNIRQAMERFLESP